MLPPLFRAQAGHKIISFNEADSDFVGSRTRWDPVFAGGAIVQFLITDPAARPPSVTKDVDAVLEIGSYGEFCDVEEVLRKAGFRRPLGDDVPIVAWLWKGRRVDFLPHRSVPHMPNPNRFFPDVLTDACRRKVEGGRFAWIASAPTFVATKFEAFFARGQGDYLLSKDIEDILAVVDGREEFIAELGDASYELAAFLRECFSELHISRQFQDALSYLITDDGRDRVVLDRLARISRL